MPNFIVTIGAHLEAVVEAQNEEEAESTAENQLSDELRETSIIEASFDAEAEVEGE